MTSADRSNALLSGGMLPLLAGGFLLIAASGVDAQSLTPEAGAAWRRAGAQVRDSRKEKIATITFREPHSTPFAKLPAPNGPFILEVRARHLTPDDFKELARFKTLNRLILHSGQDILVKDGVITPRPESDLKGISALAELPDLHFLRLEAMNPTEPAYAEIAKLKSLREIDNFGARLDDASLAHLGRLPELEVHTTYGNFMDSEYTKVTAAGIKGLAAAPKLRKLRFSSFPLDDDACKYMGGMKNLESLTVRDTHYLGVTFGDEGLRHLTGSAKLTQLDIGVRHCRITDEGVKHLPALKELTALDLRYAEVTDEGLKHIAKLTRLTHLDLSATAISNAGLEHLRPLTNLTYLDLRGNGSLTSAGLRPLHELKHLEFLELHGTKMYGTPARDKALAELRKALPKCKIETAASYGDPY